MSLKIAVVLADGFEEIEAIVPIDVLRRLDFEVIVCGLSEKVAGAHGVTLCADLLLKDLDHEDLDCVVLPGGMPGAANLRDSVRVLELVKYMSGESKVIAAICAAPIVLQRTGILEGRTITAHPSVKEDFKKSVYTGESVTADGKIITGRGPGASFEFACEIASALGAGAEAGELMQEMFVKI